MSGYVVAVGEIEKPVITTTLALGGADDVWGSGDTGDDWIRSKGAWSPVLFMRPKAASPLIIPKWLVCGSKEQDWARIRLVRGVQITSGTPTWITKGNVEYAVGDQTAYTITFSVDFAPPNLCNYNSKLDMIFPFDDKLQFTTTGEIVAVIARNIGTAVNVWASLSWIERTS